MSEYIEREVLRKALNEDILNDPNCPIFVAATVEQIIDLVPAADVQEVRHGHWIECDYKKLEHGFIEAFPGKGLCCSNCRTGFDKIELRIKDYCPNCGARMDGEEND